MARAQLTIDGMSCDHCVRAVQKALESVPGARVEHVSIGSAVVEYDPEQTTVDAMVDAINDEGYEASRAG